MLNVEKERQCTVCNGKAVLFDDDIKLFKCRGCSHLFTVGVQPDPETYSDKYYTQTHKNWFSNPDHGLFGFIYNSLSRSGRERMKKLLDVGCGNGDFLKYVRAVDPEIELYGIDLVHNEADAIHFIQGDFLKEDMRMKFDAVSGLAVIEHVDNPALFIKKINAVLQPEGLLALSTINNDSLIYRLARALNRFKIRAPYLRLYDKHHLQHFSNRSLKRLLEMNGFEVITRKNRNYPLKSIDLPPAGFVVRALYFSAVVLIFALQVISGSGIAQVIICRKKR